MGASETRRAIAAAEAALADWRARTAKDRAAIVRTFQTCEEVMQRELGLPPSRETKELYKRLVM